MTVFQTIHVGLLLRASSSQFANIHQIFFIVIIPVQIPEWVAVDEYPECGKLKKIDQNCESESIMSVNYFHVPGDSV